MTLAGLVWTPTPSEEVDLLLAMYETLRAVFERSEYLADERYTWDWLTYYGRAKRHNARYRSRILKTLEETGQTVNVSYTMLLFAIAQGLPRDDCQRVANEYCDKVYARYVRLCQRTGRRPEGRSWETPT